MFETVGRAPPSAGPSSDWHDFALALIESATAGLNKKRSVQIAIRLPEADRAKARVLAERKGVGNQTLLKMFVREGLIREARRG